MNVVFDQINKFLNSIAEQIAFSHIIIGAVGLFLFTIICVIISTSTAYEAKLIKAIDMLNSYFIDNPQINEDNLVAFNARMKTGKVPKQLRKQWQQFVLYREDKASSYMSFENCVSTPIKNSTFKRDVVTMNIISYILAVLSLVLGLYVSYETTVAGVLRTSLLTPAMILLLNFIVTIFLDIRHNAIVSDLYSNYQYFEVNIDKATQTLPEYVDYEVLFDKNEIKKGIPILYAYLQKRAEEEQRELERVRLRNVEHEKFDFDESGIESSLVLDRAMQEAENYIAERKKYMQDMQQINEEIYQEENNFREITKEYQRQMQVSKESFDNYKAELNEATSSIQANYLKKQQQQELDRQRNLERDYDTSSDRHKKVMESYQGEIKTIEGFIAEARKTLERAMMSEFESYSNKVYDAANKEVEIREQDKTNKLKAKIQELEEQLSSSKKELEFMYNQNQTLSEQLGVPSAVAPTEKNNKKKSKVEEVPVVNKVEEVQQVEQPVEAYIQPEVQQYQEFDQPSNEPAVATDEELDFNYSPYDYQDENFDGEYDYQAENAEDGYDYQDENYDDYAEDNQQAETFNTSEDFNYSPYGEEQPDFNYSPYGEEQPEFNYSVNEESDDEDEGEEIKFNYSPYGQDEESFNEGEELNDEEVEEDSTEQEEESIQPKRKAGRPRKVVTEPVVTEPKKGRGRPRKEQTEQPAEEKRGRGRPRKTEVEETKPEVKKGRGRPRKVEVEQEPVETEPKKGRGRPRKTEVEEVKTEVKQGRGRPRKVEVEPVEEPKKKAGRPKKEVASVEAAEPKKGRGRPKKEEAEVKTAAAEPKKGRGRPRKTEVEETKPEVKKGRGRPKKQSSESIEDIDAYLDEINEQIAKENEKIEKSAKELEKKAKIAKKK